MLSRKSRIILTLVALAIALAVLSTVAFAYAPGRYRCKGSFWSLSCPKLDANGNPVGGALPQGCNIPMSEFKTIRVKGWWGHTYTKTLGHCTQGMYAAWYDMARFEAK